LSFTPPPKTKEVLSLKLKSGVCKDCKDPNCLEGDVFNRFDVDTGLFTKNCSRVFAFFGSDGDIWLGSPVNIAGSPKKGGLSGKVWWIELDEERAGGVDDTGAHFLYTSNQKSYFGVVPFDTTLICFSGVTCNQKKGTIEGVISTGEYNSAESRLAQCTKATAECKQRKCSGS
jgi:hypothetical protein